MTKTTTTLLAALAALALLAACADGTGGGETLTELGEADDPLASGAGDMGGGDVAGSEM